MSRLAKNTERNLMIAKYAKLIYNSDRRVLILSDRTMQLAVLRDMLHGRWKVPMSEMGFYCRTIPARTSSGWSKKKTKTITETERKRTASACKILLATYGMFAIGSDIPDLAGLIYATPQSDTTQSKGRIERMVEGKRDPVLIDVYDKCYGQTIGWSKKRMSEYRRAGLKMKRIVSHE